MALAAIPAAAQQSPESLASVKLSNATITSANSGEPGFELPAQNAMMKIPPYLRIRDWNWRKRLERFQSLNGGSPMNSFVRKHQKWINGTLGCFDRMLFRGYLPIQSGWQRELFPRLLSRSTLCFGAKDVMSFLGRKFNGHSLGSLARIQLLDLSCRKTKNT
ncbi:MAG: hypothetical protein QUT30_12295 [Acidobacteriota bacterium]|nr:hypothetical protein [Acidobacteriota bacterium]